MDARAERGLQIAAVTKFGRVGNAWLVPSASGKGTYTVDPTAGACSCPDYELRKVKCKHQWAVEYTITRERTTETKPDGTTTVTESVKVAKRVTYKQDWHAYNLAQTHEAERVAELLRGLCQGIVQPPQGRGRPRNPLTDVVFSAVLKVYSTVSGRRFQSDLRECAVKGLVSKGVSYNSMFDYLERPDLTPLLKALIEESAAPLKAVEVDFAVDSSGFSTCRFDRWFDAKYGQMHQERKWLKAHLMCGVTTNIVTSVEVTPSNKNDSPYLPQLAEATAKRFTLAEVSADKGYISKNNLQAVVGLGAVPYIPFKAGTTGQGPELWRRMFHFYSLNRDTFLAHYHKRSNVETTFSMIKGKFGDSLRSKSDTAQINEVLCKVLCHNLCCLVQSFYEMGIESTFWSEGAFRAEMPLARQMAVS